MRVLVLGATGFIGRALVLRLQRSGHSVSAWVRSPMKAGALLGDAVTLVAASDGAPALAAALAEVDAVVNLAGEPVVGKRWSKKRKQALRDSRVGLTEQLVQALAAAPRKPSVLVAGSAVGYYGDRGDSELDESAAPGQGFLAELTRDWETAASKAETLGVRVVLLRTGVVLGREGGALAKMLPPFKFGLGGPIAGGRQFMPWIHLTDLVELIATALEDARYRGPLNGSAPKPVTNRAFTRALAKVLRRPAFLPLPGFALKLIFGESARVLTDSTRALPKAALALGFRYAFPELGDALADLLGSGGLKLGPVTQASPKPMAGGPSGHQRQRARYLLSALTRIEAPLEEVFAFFSQPGNLGLITPAGMGFVIEGPRPTMAAGALIDYRIQLGPLPMRWRTRIEHWQEQQAFVDSQLRGPYAVWWHEHHFRADGNATVMEDRVYYSPPLGVLGRVANRLFIAGMLERIFGYRSDAIRLRFAAGPFSSSSLGGDRRVAHQVG